jgi:3-hydroxyisobutyrate dehydrogenase-like beta-hydroxyacid dehydrogenase
VPLPQTAMTQQLMRSAMALGAGQEDYAAIIKTAERAAGVEPLPQDKP